MVIFCFAIKEKRCITTYQNILENKTKNPAPGKEKKYIHKDYWQHFLKAWP